MILEKAWEKFEKQWLAEQRERLDAELAIERSEKMKEIATLNVEIERLRKQYDEKKSSLKKDIGEAIAQAKEKAEQGLLKINEQLKTLELERADLTRAQENAAQEWRIAREQKEAYIALSRDIAVKHADLDARIEKLKRAAQDIHA